MVVEEELLIDLPSVIDIGLKLSRLVQAGLLPWLPGLRAPCSIGKQQGCSRAIALPAWPPLHLTDASFGGQKATRVPLRPTLASSLTVDEIHQGHRLLPLRPIDLDVLHRWYS